MDYKAREALQRQMNADPENANELYRDYKREAIHKLRKKMQQLKNSRLQQKMREPSPDLPAHLKLKSQNIQYRNLHKYSPHLIKVKGLYNWQIYRVRWDKQMDEILMLANMVYGINEVRVFKEKVNAFRNISVAQLASRTYALLGVSSVLGLKRPLVLDPVRIANYFHGLIKEVRDSGDEELIKSQLNKRGHYINTLPRDLRDKCAVLYLWSHLFAYNPLQLHDARAILESRQNFDPYTVLIVDPTDHRTDSVKINLHYDKWETANLETAIRSDI
jgi:hypothetical protein